MILSFQDHLSKKKSPFVTFPCIWPKVCISFHGKTNESFNHGGGIHGVEKIIEPKIGPSLADVLLCTFESTNAGFSSFPVRRWRGEYNRGVKLPRPPDAQPPYPPYTADSRSNYATKTFVLVSLSSSMVSGLGFSAVLVSFFVSFYYNVIIGWAFHFLISSFNYQLPWKVPTVCTVLYHLCIKNK